MKLQTKLLLITDSIGKDINVEDRNIAIELNGERIPNKLQDIFSDLEFDDGEIYGNSLLSYYQINEDGSLGVEGSKVQLVDADTNEAIRVRGMKRPSVHDDTNISFVDIQKFAEYFKIDKPEEVFFNLTADEKQVFISAMESSTEAKKNQQTADQAAEQASAAAIQAEADRLVRLQAETALRASIDPAYVQNKAAYISTQSFYAGTEGFKEYTSDKYHLFYGEDPNQSLCILIKRGDTWWEEVKEDKAEIIDKNNKAVVIEFTDGDQLKHLTLDLEAGQIAITDANTQE